jgi:glycosyltransferase involved in cell wall biosynthesis
MMLELLKTRMPVHVFDRAPGHAGPLRFARQLAGPFRYLAGCFRRRNQVLYLALSGGRGQFFDLAYVLAGKLFRQHVVIHHHSFAYINSPSWLSRSLLALVRRDTHVVLSRNMGASLIRIYGLKADGVKVVSNAAFYGSTDDDTVAATGEAAPINVGFLSNITFEKGFVEFFGILRQLKQLGVEYRAHIAGPLAPGARPTFDKLLGEASNVQYVGPVYGADKERFYQRLDIFLFPTNYANEAEPLVIYEAMRHGVYVIACDRGAISEMLLNGAGLALARNGMVASAATHIANFSRDRRALADTRERSRLQAQRIRSSGRLELESLLVRMQGG